eukprot:2350336-Amphidinium_carterae.1
MRSGRERGLAHGTCPHADHSGLAHRPQSLSKRVACLLSHKRSWAIVSHALVSKERPGILDCVSTTTPFCVWWGNMRIQ